MYLFMIEYGFNCSMLREGRGWNEFGVKWDEFGVGCGVCAKREHLQVKEFCSVDVRSEQDRCCH